MRLRLLSAKDFNVRLKATIQSSGRLGFTEPTAKKLELKTDKWMKFAKDEDTGEMYLAVCLGKTEDAFPVRVSAGYYYVTAKSIFDSMGLDYAHQTIMFDLEQTPMCDDFFGGVAYKMNKRIRKKIK